MLKCRQATQLLSEKMDRDLKFKEKSALNFHLMICTSCSRFGKQIRILSEASKLYAHQSFIDLDIKKSENND